MEKYKHNKTLFAAVLLFFLATSVYAVSPPAKGRSPRVLLQKAIYAETTEGDLDKAIEIYQEVIERADKIEEIAARATYQLGMCYLKKGEKNKAAEYFQRAVSNYPTQKSIAKKAQKQLSKLQPPAANSIPMVIAISPTVYANDVSPSLDKINVTFDQPMMDGSWSWTGGGETFPEITGKIHYNYSKTTCTLPVKLKAGNVYWIGVNSPSHKNFKTQQRVPAKRYVIIFATKDKNGNATPIPKDRLARAKAINSASDKAAGWKEIYLPDADDIIAKSYVIHYKAIDQSKDALELLNRNHPKGVNTHHANRYRENGETTNSICTDTEEGKDKIVAVIDGSDELKLVKVVPPIKQAKAKSVFEQIDYQVTRFLGEQFGKTALEAGQQHLSVNSHIYYIDCDGFRYQGGMNSFYNWTGRTLTRKVSFGGTSYPNQTHYGVDGHELKTEIVPDKTRPNHWQIYWTPDEPLAPEEQLYYGWSLNNKRKLPKLPGDVYSLTMQNKHGEAVIETFFLVLPKNLKISQSNPPTGNQELLNFNVYWWTKTVQQGENHLERVQLKKNSSAQYAAMLKNKVTVSVAKSPDGDRLTVQYAAIEICKTADVPYQWDKSQKLAGEKVRRYIEPLNFENTAANEALNSILEQLGLKYVVDADGVYLIDTKEAGKIVKNVILTISTCTESDPKVARSLKKLEALDETAAVSEIAEYLDSNKPTVRRSAIFVLWRGEFDSIAPAEQKLLELCRHDENATRGMAAIALGAAKVPASFETLTDMTLNDADGYARRCSAYALGLYGDEKALEVLNKALKDKDPMVKQNAQAAITMLTELKETQN